MKFLKILIFFMSLNVQEKKNKFVLKILETRKVKTKFRRTKLTFDLDLRLCLPVNRQDYSKTTDQISVKFSKWLDIIQGPIDYIFSDLDP